jgi:ion channel-forming bestrophin family protein
MLISARPAWRYVLPQVGWPLFILFLYSAAITLLMQGNGFMPFVSLPDLPLSLMGAALGIFLAFRTNSAYDRWWEARTIWGHIVNHSRSLTRQALTFTEGDLDHARRDAWRRGVVETQIAWVHALRSHLRREDVLATIVPYVDDDRRGAIADAVNKPVALLQLLGTYVATAYRTGMIGGFELQRLDETISALTDAQGGCERIKNTPLPRQYDLFPEFFTYAYCALLPLGLVSRMGLATAPLVVLIAFVFLATNRIGRNIENPFEGLPHDTPMSALSFAIETDLRQALGDTRLPEPARPRRGVLM